MSKVSPFIYINLTSACCSCFFLLFLLLTYFTKKNMNNIENKVYKHMLVFNTLSTFFYICFYTTDLFAVFSKDPDALYPVVYFFSKLAPLAICYWGVFFAVYVYYITHEFDKNFLVKFQTNQKHFFKNVYSIFLIIAIFHFMEHSVVDLRSGVEVKLLFVMNATLYSALAFSLFFIIKNFKKIEKKKLLPVFLILPLAFIAMLIAISGMPLIVIFIMMTAINHLMFHTIENPDVKLINELELAKSQAEKASQAKSDFLSSMSHELRTPINAISGLSQMIILTDDVKEMHDDSQEILVASQKLLELVDSVLDINKIEANQIEVVKENYNPITIFNTLIGKISMRIGEKPISLKTDISSDIPTTLNGDSQKIKIILTNLLTNAVKYTESGEIGFKVNSVIEKNKCHLEFIVSDTGRGIKEEQMDLLFTKFYRMEEDKDSDIEGTGLGLAITKSLVELMDGKITVNSTFGVGTTFTVKLTQDIGFDGSVIQTPSAPVVTPAPVVQQPTPVVTPAPVEPVMQQPTPVEPVVQSEPVNQTTEDEQIDIL